MPRSDLRCFAALAALVLLAWSSAAAAQSFWTANPNLRWRTLHTEHFSVHFSEARREDARLAAAVAEKVYPFVTRQLRWEPRSRTHILLLDSFDLSNGFATPLPFNYSGIFLTPPDDGELLQSRDWLEMVLVHEFTHIVHMDKARGFPLALRNTFGRLWPTFPNAIEPSWIIEGLAVHNESDAAMAYGRLGNTHFEAMMRAEVARGLRSLAEVNADGRGFPLNRAYLYGGYFFAFLRERYGDNAIRQLVESYSGKLFWYPIDSNPERATGRTMAQLWVEYHEWLRERFAARPDAPAPREGEVLARAWTIFSPVLTPSGDRWYAQGDGYTLPSLVRQARGGKPEALRETENDTRVAALGNDGVLLSQLEVCENYQLYYDLYRVEASGRGERLTECGRNRLAAPLPDGRVVVVRLSGVTAEVALLDERGKAVRTLYRAADGESVVGLAAKGKSVVISSLRDGAWSLVDVAGSEPVVLVSDAAIKHSLRFGASADEIFFIADYGKAYNVWSLKLGSRSMQRWTQALNGVKEMSDPVDGEVLLVTIEADGDALRLYRLPDAPLEQRYAPSLAGMPEARAEARVAAADEPYSPWSSLRPHAWVPIIDAADGAFAVGASVFGQDALGLHQYVFAPLYEFTQHQLLGSLDYVYDRRHGLLVNRTMTVKATRDDKVRRYSIKENAQWVSTWQHLALNRRFYWGLGAAVEHEKEREVDDGTTPLKRERVVGLVAGVDTRRRQWLSEGPSQGQWLRLFAETSDKLKADYTGNVVRADWRGHLPIRSTVLALRWNEAYGTLGAQRFELGGSKSDEYILLPVLNEREFALRGYTSGGDPGLVGHRARVLTAEWRTPLADIDRHAMTPPLGINRVSLNLFYDLGAAWERGGSPDYHRGIGVELLGELQAIYAFGLQVRAGLAKGLDAGGETKFYLRAGRSF